MIYLKKSLNKWITVDVENKIEFLIEYPSIEQGEKLAELKYEAIGRYVEYSGENKPKLDLLKFLAYKRYFLKCVIKDWKGLSEKCLLVNGELDTELHWALVANEGQLNQLYELINAELDFTEDDKKKLDSANISPTTVTEAGAEGTTL
jgi:hypothetical protein